MPEGRPTALSSQALTEVLFPKPARTECCRKKVLNTSGVAVLEKKKSRKGKRKVTQSTELIDDPVTSDERTPHSEKLKGWGKEEA